MTNPENLTTAAERVLQLIQDHASELLDGRREGIRQRLLHVLMQRTVPFFLQSVRKQTKRKNGKVYCRLIQGLDEAVVDLRSHLPSEDGASNGHINSVQMAFIKSKIRECLQALEKNEKTEEPAGQTLLADIKWLRRKSPKPKNKPNLNRHELARRGRAYSTRKYLRERKKFGTSE